MTDDKMQRRLSGAAVGLLAACCAVHLILLTAGVGALAAAAAGASVVAIGVLLIGAGLFWATRRRAVSGPVDHLEDRKRHQSPEEARHG
jgi:hypothetical protein